MFWDICLSLASGHYPNFGIPEHPYGHKSCKISNSNQDQLWLLLCAHCWITERYSRFLYPSLGLHPCLFSLSFGFNLGSGCGEQMLCAFSAALARSLSFHRCPLTGTSPALMLISCVEVHQIQKPSPWEKNCSTRLCAIFALPERDTHSSLHVRSSGSGSPMLSK